VVNPTALASRSSETRTHHKQIGQPNTDWVFTASHGKLPFRMSNILRREILPSLMDVEWHGWQEKIAVDKACSPS